jgi:hypothetical protein
MKSINRVRRFIFTPITLKCSGVIFYCCFSVISTPKAIAQALPNEIQRTLSDVRNPESEPVAFKSSYVGLLLNQNQPWSDGSNTWSSGGPSWGAEYRFFYKDQWSLSISGSFKQLYNTYQSEASLFVLSQESTRITRLYHPLYVGIGGRLSYIVPVNKIEIPYTRDQSRLIDTGAGFGASVIMITDLGVVITISAHRWRSLSTTKRQGFELSLSGLISFR